MHKLAGLHERLVPPLVSDAAARTSLALLPAAALFSFVSTAIADVALAALMLMAFPLVMDDRALRLRAVIVLSVAWMSFVVVAAGWATAEALPGKHWAGIGKHLPVALGPFVGVSLALACARLRVPPSAAVMLFLAGLVAGAAILLARNGGLGLSGALLSADGSFGRINRNYAAFSCGLSLIAIAGLLCHVSAVTTWSASRRVAAAAILGILFLWMGFLLLALQSRTAYMATTLGMAAWLSCFVYSTAVERELVTARTARAIAAAVVVAIVGASAIFFSAASPRLALEGSFAANLHVAGELLLGRTQEVAPLLSGMETRLQLYATAADLIYQRPQLGWGPDVSGLIGLHSQFAPVRELTQFHNGYVQHLVSFGLAGTALMLVLVAAILHEAWSARGGHDTSAGREPLSRAAFAAAIGLIAYLLAFNVTESIFLVKPAAVTLIFVIALACARSRIGDDVGTILLRRASLPAEPKLPAA